MRDTISKTIITMCCGVLLGRGLSRQRALLHTPALCLKKQGFKRADVVVYISHPSTPMVRREVGTRGLGGSTGAI